MKKPRSLIVACALLVAAVLFHGCGDDASPTDPDQDPVETTNLPPIPEPSSPNDALPAKSDDLIIGLSEPLETFEPVVARREIMKDDGAVEWLDENRRLVLACPDAMPEYASDQALTRRAYLSDRPRLLHRRYWRLVKQVPLDPGSSYSREESITYGTSTMHQESREFSRTIGVEVTVEGTWSAFKASVAASYEQTETSTEVDAVTFSEESTITETYSQEPDPDHTIVYAIWQLVDKFTLVDADTVLVHDSAVLAHVELNEIADIEFPSEIYIRPKVTRF